jgi:hypothetical protein
MDRDALEVLEPVASVVQFRGERLEIRPLTVGQLPRLVRAARPRVERRFADASVARDASAAILHRLVGETKADGDVLIHAVAVAANLPLERVAKARFPEVVSLAIALLDVNADFFVQAHAPGKPAVDGQWGWEDSLQLLIQSGHALADIRGYTLHQFRAFTEAAARSARRRLADNLAIARVAQYERKDYEAVLRKLSHG